MNQLGVIEYYGEIIPITWNDYLSIMWTHDPDILVVNVPENPNEK